MQFLLGTERIYLDEANFLCIAAEALPAAHQSVLPDQPMRVPTHSAVQSNQIDSYVRGTQNKENW